MHCGSGDGVQTCDKRYGDKPAERSIIDIGKTGSRENDMESACN